MKVSMKDNVLTIELEDGEQQFFIMPSCKSSNVLTISTSPESYEQAAARADRRSITSAQDDDSDDDVVCGDTEDMRTMRELYADEVEDTEDDDETPTRAGKAAYERSVTQHANARRIEIVRDLERLQDVAKKSMPMKGITRCIYCTEKGLGDGGFFTKSGVKWPLHYIHVIQKHNLFPSLDFQNWIDAEIVDLDRTAKLHAKRRQVLKGKPATKSKTTPKKKGRKTCV